MCERTKPKIKNVFSLICYVIKKKFFLLFTLNILHGYNRRFSLINIKTSMDVCDLCDAKFFYRNFSKKTPCYSCQNLLNQINDMRCACIYVCVCTYVYAVEYLQRFLRLEQYVKRFVRTFLHF